MDFTVTWTATAFADLEEIVTGIARRSQSGAERIRLGILKHVESLRVVPYIGPIYPRDRTRQTREISFEKYRVFYRVKEDSKSVVILRIWSASREEPDWLG
jgi:plasmid stabilization system protein ParE